MSDVFYKVELFIPYRHYNALLDFLAGKETHLRMSFPHAKEAGGFVQVFGPSTGAPKPLGGGK